MRGFRLQLLKGGRSDLVGRHRLFGAHLFSRLVLAETLESSLTNHAVGGPSGELYFGDQFRLDPRDVFTSAGRTLAGEGAGIGRQRDKLLEETNGIVLVEACSDPPRMNQVVTPVNS